MNEWILQNINGKKTAFAAFENIEAILHPGKLCSLAA